LTQSQTHLLDEERVCTENICNFDTFDFGYFPSCAQTSSVVSITQQEQTF
jgi:hypothetical protein